jgi:hypothetical protein
MKLPKLTLKDFMIGFSFGYIMSEIFIKLNN